MTTTIYFLLRWAIFVTPVAGSNSLPEKVSWFSELSQNSNSQRLFQSKPSNLVKWTRLISAEFSLNSPHFTTLQPRGLFLVCFFFKKSHSNVWEICQTTPQTRARKLKFLISNKNGFRNGSRPRAGWPVRLVLVRATPRAEVDVISVLRC